MREPAATAYYIDRQNPQHPIHAKVAYAKRMGLRRITEEEARALSAALRAGQQAPELGPEPQEPEPAPSSAPEPEAIPEPSVPPRQPFSMADLLASASKDQGGQLELPTLPPPAAQVLEPPIRPIITGPLSDLDRKEAARAQVRKAVAEANRVERGEWMDYEQALLIRNKNVEAMQNFQVAAATRGITVQELADQIISEHMARGRRAGHVAALQASAEQAIDQASEDDIETIAREAVRAIRNGDDE